MELKNGENRHREREKKKGRNWFIYERKEQIEWKMESDNEWELELLIKRKWLNRRRQED